MSKFVEKVSKVKSVFNTRLDRSGAIMSVAVVENSDEVEIVVGADFSDSCFSYFDKEGIEELIGHLQEIYDAL